MKRGNVVMVGVSLAVMVAVMVVTLKRPDLVAPYAKLLPRWAWRSLQVVSFLLVYGLTGLAIARRRRERRSRAWTPPPTTPFRR
ncbi:MAG TPA: hypothetical protein VHM31_25020 [Polyangia bacterium]|nr:hypothetical protein [Polyangia bacterium]